MLTPVGTTWRLIPGRTGAAALLIAAGALLATGCETTTVNDGRYSMTGMNTRPTQTYARPKPAEPTLLDHMVNPLRPVGRALFGWIPSLPAPAPEPPPKPASSSYLGVTGKPLQGDSKGQALGVPGGEPGFGAPR